MNAEARINRKVFPDTRVHCCLYFISPNGHGFVFLTASSVLYTILTSLQLVAVGLRFLY